VGSNGGYAQEAELAKLGPEGCCDGFDRPKAAFQSCNQRRNAASPDQLFMLWAAFLDNV
jgi:hypothetical protein